MQTSQFPYRLDPTFLSFYRSGIVSAPQGSLGVLSADPQQLEKNQGESASGGQGKGMVL